VVLAPYVSLFAPATILQGQITVADDTVVNIGRIEVSSGYGVIKPLGQTGVSRVEAQTVVATGSASGAINLATAGVLIYECRTTLIENGNAVGDISAANGHTHIMLEDIYLTGPAAGIVRSGSGTTVGYVAHILEFGAGVGAGAGIICNGGEVSLKVLSLSANTAYNVGASGTLRLDANQITGTAAGTGTAYVNTAGFVSAAPGNWNPPVPTDLNNAIDRLASAVSGLLGGTIP